MGRTSFITLMAQAFINIDTKRLHALLMPVYIPPPANDYLSLSLSLGNIGPGEALLPVSFHSGPTKLCRRRLSGTEWLSRLLFVWSLYTAFPPPVQLLHGVASAVDVRCACTVLASAHALRVLVVQASGIVIISHSRAGCFMSGSLSGLWPFLRAATLI